MTKPIGAATLKRLAPDADKENLIKSTKGEENHDDANTDEPAAPLLVAILVHKDRYVSDRNVSVWAGVRPAVVPAINSDDPQSADAPASVGGFFVPLRQLAERRQLAKGDKIRCS